LGENPKPLNTLIVLLKIYNFFNVKKDLVQNSICFKDPWAFAP
jgi:hypothetical protein